MDEKIYDVLRDDPRYPLEAYEFVCDTVAYTQEMLGRAPQEEDDPETDYHVTGGELVRGACEFAVQEFGLMAPMVFKMWNIRRTDDVGNIVFNLIRAEQLSQSDRDDPNDFRDLFDIQKALADGFQMTTARPSKKKGTR